MDPVRLKLKAFAFLLALIPNPASGVAAPQAAPLEQHYQAALTALKQRDTETAKRELKLSLQDNPLHAESHFLLGSLLGREGDIDQAMVGYQRTIVLEPGNAAAQYNLGTALLCRGEPVPAARLLEEAVLIRPEHVPSYNNLAKAYFLAGLPGMAGLGATCPKPLRLPLLPDGEQRGLSRRARHGPCQRVFGLRSSGRAAGNEMRPYRRQRQPRRTVTTIPLLAPPSPNRMSIVARIKHELKAVGAVTLFFGVWIGALITLKTLILEEYHVSFTGWSKVLLGALVLGKVVIVLEHVPLGGWVQARPASVAVLLRTMLYTAGVALVLTLEHALERHSATPSVGREVPHVLVNTLCLCGALLAFNVLSVIRGHLGPGGLLRLFLKPPTAASVPENRAH
jgi:hypothetical protein